MGRCQRILICFLVSHRPFLPLSLPRPFPPVIQSNDKLDQSIAAFLRLLSPHFLLGAAHKVLEYFIRRYQVHDHNVEALLECALPYHETNYFARLLQLLKYGRLFLLSLLSLTSYFKHLNVISSG